MYTIYTILYVYYTIYILYTTTCHTYIHYGPGMPGRELPGPLGTTSS